MLKDEQSSVNCVMFRQNVTGLRLLPKDGQRVRVAGRATLYPRDGRFQLMVTGMMPRGEGALFAAFAAYREELKRLGWFDESEKKPIPFLPKAVGLVTSAAGAARHDVQTVIGRRFPLMPVLLYPAAVQGAGAAEEIAKAIDLADAEHRCDVLIVGRGGGSMEDLWAFNERPVAEAIRRCSIPVISAVGHETDVSISDFVADLRAATPSAAAELAVPEWDTLKDSLASAKDRISGALRNGIKRKRDRLLLIWSDAPKLRVRRAIEQDRLSVEDARSRTRLQCERTLETRRHLLERAAGSLRAYSPQRTLERGFALVSRPDGGIVKAAEQIEPGESITVRFADGTVRADVTGKETK
jgi:exodeoxyribonuclease VII large subunit